MERIFTSKKHMIRDIPRVLLVVKYLLVHRMFMFSRNALLLLCDKNFVHNTA